MSDDAGARLLRLVKSAFGAFKRLSRNLEPNYEFHPSQQETVVLDALTQHGEHLRVHQIEQKTIDAFKLVCWLGGSILKGLEHNEDGDRQSVVVIDALIKTLEELLIIESEAVLILPAATRTLLKSLLRQERSNNPNHGIWMNGLYMSFHCPIATWREGQKRAGSRN